MALAITSGLTYGLAYLAYQPRLDEYEEKVSELESSLKMANSSIETLKDERAKQADRYRELSDEHEALLAEYMKVVDEQRELADRWNNISKAAERLKTDKDFLKKRLNQIVITTYTFEDELALWNDMKLQAERVDPALLPLIDTLIEDYRAHFEWVEDIGSQELDPIEAVMMFNRGYDLIWQVINDLREFDAYWIETLEEDIEDILNPMG